MADDHWFDRLNRSLTQEASRRGSLGAAIAFVAALGLMGERVSEAQGKKQRSKPPSCSDGACRREFRTKKDRKHCEFICRQCDGDDPRQFCIVKSHKPNGDPTKVARCCKEGKECCDGFCCGSSQFRCCHGKCINTEQSRNHCGGCNRPCVGPGQECCNGTCVVTRNNGAHCGGCDKKCPASKPTCCGVECVDTKTDAKHCGQPCRDCTSMPDRSGECCHGVCPFAGWTCCRDHTNFPLYCPPRTTCCTNAEGEPDCCP
jgi:hypothetical protein